MLKPRYTPPEKLLIVWLDLTLPYASSTSTCSLRPWLSQSTRYKPTRCQRPSSMLMLTLKLLPEPVAEVQAAASRPPLGFCKARTSVVEEAQTRLDWPEKVMPVT